MRELVEREAQAVEEADGLFDRLRRLGEEPRHLGAPFKCRSALAWVSRPAASSVDALADAGDDVGERCAARGHASAHR